MFSEVVSGAMPEPASTRSSGSVRHVGSSEPQPKQALCGFARLHLAKGENASATVEIPTVKLRYWNTANKQYEVEPGKYELLVGAASDDIRLRVPFVIGAN